MQEVSPLLGAPLAEKGLWKGLGSSLVGNSVLPVSWLSIELHDGYNEYIVAFSLIDYTKWKSVYQASSCVF